MKQPHVHRFSASPHQVPGWHTAYWYRACLGCGHRQPITAALAQQVLGRRSRSLEVARA